LNKARLTTIDHRTTGNHRHPTGADRRIGSTRISTMIVFYTTPVDATQVGSLGRRSQGARPAYG
jgi:hypothetical protein